MTTPTVLDAAKQSSQVFPDAISNPYGGGSYLYQSGGRGDLLPAYGTRDRLLALRRYYRHDYNYMVRGAFSGIAKRIASLPFEIHGGDEDDGTYGVEYYQAVLRDAQVGSGWTNFVKAIVLDFLRFDTGAFVEVIADGDTMEAVNSPIIGIANLDAIRCYPTGDPIYPVVYWDDRGKAHTMHNTRVIRIYDMPDNDEIFKGWGDCALARAISIVNREILMGRYVEQSLDDNPPPGIMVASNINRQQLEAALKEYSQNRQTDSGGVWGKNLWLYGMGSENAAKLESVSFSNPPDKFSYKEYTELDVDALALAIGVDRQELWQLTGGNLGSAGQSEILNLKSRGKTLGDLISSLERMVNDLLPESMEFSFKYRDETENISDANTAQAWATAVATMGANITQQEAREILAANVPTVSDALTDDNGALITVSDTITTEDSNEITVDDSTQGTPQDDIAVDDTLAQKQLDNRVRRQRHANRYSKAYGGTLSDYTGKIEALITRAADATNVVKPRNFIAAVRGYLADYGERAYKDALDSVGITDLSDDDILTIEKVYNAQQKYVNGLADAVYGTTNSDGDTVGKRVSASGAGSRAQMWGKSLQEFYNAGLLAADADSNYEWEVGNTEHCDDCLRLNGQVHRLSAWNKNGWLPRSSKLKCKGYHCKCTISKTKARQRGRF